jgi:hypothetical protein
MPRSASDHRLLRDLGAVLAAGLLALCAGSTAAANLEGVLSPGELIKGHAKAETQCENCHTPFQKTEQDLLCEKCHKEVARDIEQKSGYHGHIKERGACRSCHTDHKGRAAKIVELDENQFDHDKTRYPLKDAHRSVKCATCHSPGAKWRDAAKTCVACHKADDSKNGHKGTLGDRCEDCHTVKKWKVTFFDHDKTRFALRDAHADPKVACKDCHANDRFKNTPRDCYACHKKADEGKGGHHGRYGQKCESCHVEKDWRTIKFDHDRDTKYPLRYLHRDPKVRCDDCHSRDLYRDKLSTDCIACHKKDDKHKGSEGDKCEKCHSERGWKQTHDFDHDRTKFPLKGKHGDPRVKCADCHKTQIYTEAPHACYACHKKDDDGSRGHHERYGQKCESCHVEKDWKTIKFDHDRDTRYPLLGKHQSTKCYDCHTGDLYKDKTPNSCIGCHRKDDKHKGKEGDRCEQCHVEQNWKTTKSKFDHDLTGLPLLGQHVKVDCAKCHKSLAFKDAKSACVSCHEKDDRHRRRLGSRCEDCHNAVSWRRWEFDHARRARFLLDGAHAKTDCYACHRHPIEGRALLPIGCASCHENDDAHSASFGRQCERCHVTSQWKNVKPRLGARPLSPLSQMFVPPKPNGATRSYAASTS